MGNNYPLITSKVTNFYQ